MPGDFAAVKAARDFSPCIVPPAPAMPPKTLNPVEPPLEFAAMSHEELAGRAALLPRETLVAVLTSFRGLGDEGCYWGTWRGASSASTDVANATDPV